MQRYRFILVFNRDEYYDRPTSDSMFWDDLGMPHVLAGMGCLYDPDK